MKLVTLAAAALAAGLASAAPAVSQTQPAPSSTDPAPVTSPTSPNVAPSQPAIPDAGVAQSSPPPITTATPTQPPAPPIREMTASALADKDLVGQNGIELGEIERVMENRGDKKRFLVVSRGGFLGFFEKEYAVPVDQVAVQGETVKAPTMTEGQLEALPVESIGTDFRSLDGSQTVSLTEQR